MDPYMKGLENGVIYSQNRIGEGVYKNKEDLNNSNKRERPFKSVTSINTSSLDFIHLRGKDADPRDTSTRVYITAKTKYKSMAVSILLKTISEQKLQDKLYLKFCTEPEDPHGYGADDLVIYLGSNLTEKQKKNLIDSFYEKCKKAGESVGDPPAPENILSGEDMVVSGHSYRDGIALAGEPEIASLMNEHFSNEEGHLSSKYTDRNRLQSMTRGNQTSKTLYSFNSFVSQMLVQSTFLAAKRLKKPLGEAVSLQSDEMNAEIRKIFRELCFLNGINPVNMSSIDSRSLFG